LYEPYIFPYDVPM